DPRALRSTLFPYTTLFRSKLAALCSQCGTANAPIHKFCKKCGQSLTAASGVDPEGRRFASPDSYTPKHLAEKILTSKSALEGERDRKSTRLNSSHGSISYA